MKKYKEYMNEMTREGRITLAVGAILILLVLISLVIFYVKNADTKDLKSDKRSDSALKNEAHPESETERFINKATESVFNQNDSKENSKPGVTSNKNTQTITSVKSQAPVENVYASKSQEVKIALIIDQNEYDVKNVIKGVCGNVYMVTAYVPGPMVLTNSIKALFGDKIFGDFLPGNIIPTYHPLLSFKDVTITNGVARIYLNGNFNSAQMNSCDNQLAIAQLAETAKYYPTVTKVEIYQNGILIN